VNKSTRIFLMSLEIFSLVALIVVTSVFVLVFHYGRNQAVIIAVYVALALGTDVIAVGHILIVQNSENGRAPVWLVVFTYSKLCQSIAYTGISLFVISSVMGWHIPFGGQLAGGLVSCAAAGATLTAITFVALWRSNVGFNYRIRPWPWQVVKDIAEGKEEPEER
jgi:hypothetical protein